MKLLKCRERTGDDRLKEEAWHKEKEPQNHMS